MNDNTCPLNLDSQPMADDRHNSTRRRFLQGIGLVGAAAAVPALGRANMASLTAVGLTEAELAANPLQSTLSVEFFAPVFNTSKRTLVLVTLKNSATKPVELRNLRPGSLMINNLKYDLNSYLAKAPVVIRANGMHNVWLSPHADQTTNKSTAALHNHSGQHTWTIPMNVVQGDANTVFASYTQLVQAGVA